MTLREGGTMNKLVVLVFTSMLLVAGGDVARGATTVPNEIQQPGTQPSQVGNLESPDKCDNCHGGYNQAVEPAFNWRGSMMANAGRDPIFWATMAVAEQDFDGAGDLCIRCHSTGGWYGGRSTPTDGSALTAMDADGVDCDTCHKMTNPNQVELPGVMLPPFLANNEMTPATGYYGSGNARAFGGRCEARSIQRRRSPPPVHPIQVPPRHQLLRLMPRCLEPGSRRSCPQ